MTLRDIPLAAHRAADGDKPLERGVGVAVWLQIARILEAEISRQEYGEAGRLPSESDLARRFAVNRHTVRRALLALAAQGLVNVEQGRGTFVQQGMVDYAIGRRTRFSENLRSLGAEVSCEVLENERLKAAPEIARALQLRANTLVYRLVTRHWANGVPLSCATSWFPAARFPGLPEAVARHGSITAALAELGVKDYVRATSRIASILPDGPIGRYLSVNRQQPVLRVENIDADADGVPIKFAQTHFAGDRVQLVVEPEAKLSNQRA